MDIAKADNGTFGFGAGQFDARGPVGLQNHSHGSWRHGFDQFFKKCLGRKPLLRGLLKFRVSEFFLEPAHHPVSPVNLNLQGMKPRDCRRIGGQQGNGLHIFFVGDVDGRGGAIAETADARIQTSRANDLAGLVGSNGNDGKAGGFRRFRGDRAKRLRDRNKSGQNRRIHGNTKPFPVPASGPSMIPVIKGKIAHLTSDGVHKFPCQLKCQKPGKQQVFICLPPDIRLVGTDPVGFSFSLKIADGIAEVRSLENQAPGPTDGKLAVGFSLVKPEHGRPKGLSGSIHIDDRSALAGERYSGYARFLDNAFFPVRGLILPSKLRLPLRTEATIRSWSLMACEMESPSGPLLPIHVVHPKATR